MATLVRFWAAPLLGDRYVFGTYYVVIAALSWRAGIVPAGLAAVSGVLLADYFFFRGIAGSALGRHPDAFEFVAYGLIAGTLIALITRLQAREQSLRTALQNERDVRARLKAVETATGTFEWEWDVAADRLHTSKGAEACLGAGPHRIDDVRRLIHPEDLPGAEAAVARMLAADAEPTRFAFRIQLPDRHVATWLEVRGVGHRGADGRTERARGIAIDITERQRALEAAATAEQRFKVALSASDMLAWACDADRRYTWVYNPSRGFQAEDFVGRPLASLLPRDTYADYADAIDRVWQSGQGESLPVQWTYQGETRQYIATIEPVKDAAGRVAGLVGASVDVTALRAVETEARRSAEKLARTFDASPDGLVVSRVADGRILEVNSSFLRLFDLHRDAIVGRRLSELGLLDDLHRALLKPQLDRGLRLRDVEVELQSNRGRRWSALLSVEPLEGTPTETVLNIVRDVTALREAEAFGRLNQDWLHLATEGAQIGTWTTDLSTGLTECDARNRALFDLPAEPERLPNELWVARIHPDDLEAVNAGWRRAAEAHTPYQASYRIVRRDGDVRWIETRAHFHPPSGSTPARAYGISMDVTEKKQAEVAAAEAARRKDEFLATLAHELRNPLAPIRYASRLLRSTTPPAMIDDLGQMIERQLAQMSRLLDDLLDVSRITRGVLELKSTRIDLRSQIEAAVASARGLVEGAGLTLELQLAEAPMPVEGDGARLLQILENLLSNAVRYTDRGGQITVHGLVDRDFVTVEVRDTGIGIAASKLEQIFELFNQGEATHRSASGLGIGLTLSRRLAELHHGRLEARSAGLGAGSTFVLRLPRAAEAAALQESISAPAKVAVLGGTGARVLVVDDNIDAADALAQVLSLSGCETRVAYDGRGVAELVSAWRPTVVLLDIGLPQLSGYDVARQLRQSAAGRAAYLVAVTGWGSPDDRERAAEAGFDEHLTKPVDPELLLQALAKAVSGSDVASPSQIPRRSQPASPPEPKVP